MNHAKMLAFAILAVAACIAGTGSAVAATPTSPAGFIYTGTVKAEAEGTTTLTASGGSGFEAISCKRSTVEGKVENHGPGVTVKGNISSLTFTECTGGTPTTPVAKPGSLSIGEIEPSGDSKVLSSGAEVIVHATAVGKCIFVTNNTSIGRLTGSATTKGNATLDIAASIPNNGLNPFCGSNATWEGSYKVATPATLDLENFEGTAVTSPAGSVYTGAVKAEADGHVLLTGPFGSFGSITCPTSIVEGKVENHGIGALASGKVTSLTFGGCAGGTPTSPVVKPGTLSVARSGTAGDGTVFSDGAEVIAHNTSVGTCIFLTSSTDIGQLTGSATTKGNATLDIAASIPNNGSNPFCGSSSTWEGAYKVTTPGTLEVGVPAGANLTSPAGTVYTSTVKAEAEGHALLTGPFGSFGSITCPTSVVEGKVESHGKGAPATGKISSLTFGGCTGGTPTSPVVKPGTISVIPIGTAGDGTVVSDGAEVIAHNTSVGTCIFLTSSSDIGRLTGSATTKGNATLDISAKIGNDGSNPFCGSTSTWEGSYKVTTPGTLEVD